MAEKNSMAATARLADSKDAGTPQQDETGLYNKLISECSTSCQVTAAAVVGAALIGIGGARKIIAHTREMNMADLSIARSDKIGAADLPFFARPQHITETRMPLGASNGASQAENVLVRQGRLNAVDKPPEVMLGNYKYSVRDDGVPILQQLGRTPGADLHIIKDSTAHPINHLIKPGQDLALGPGVELRAVQADRVTKIASKVVENPSQPIMSRDSLKQLTLPETNPVAIAPYRRFSVAGLFTNKPQDTLSAVIYPGSEKGQLGVRLTLADATGGVAKTTPKRGAFEVNGKPYDPLDHSELKGTAVITHNGRPVFLKTDEGKLFQFKPNTEPATPKPEAAVALAKDKGQPAAPVRAESGPKPAEKNPKDGGAAAPQSGDRQPAKVQPAGSDAAAGRPANQPGGQGPKPRDGGPQQNSPREGGQRPQQPNQGKPRDAKPSQPPAEVAKTK